MLVCPLILPGALCSPEVVLLSESTGESPEASLGRLSRLYSWAHNHPSMHGAMSEPDHIIAAVMGYHSSDATMVVRNLQHSEVIYFNEDGDGMLCLSSVFGMAFVDTSTKKFEGSI